MRLVDPVLASAGGLLDLGGEHVFEDLFALGLGFCADVFDVEVYCCGE